MNFWLVMLITSLSPLLIQQRILAGQIGRHDLLTFAQLATPLPSDPLNPNVSRYSWERHHRVIADALMQVERSEINRLEIELPPRHGKSELSVRQFVPWFIGKNPTKSIIVVTHTDTLAKEHGRDVRDYFQGPAFKLVFGDDPQAQLRDNSLAADRLQTVGGGVMTFSGKAGLGAGLGGDIIIADDFFKNSEEAQSIVERENAWRTFISDCQSRLNNQNCPVVMIGSRRHEDDVQGRLFDPTSLHYDPREAAKWKRIRIPALSEGEGEGDPLGREKDEAIWPERFGADFYIAKRNHASEIVRIDFQTQDQCNPTPAEGNYFKKTWVATYRPEELPGKLRYYAASDHAYRKGQNNDRNCLLVVGVDPSDTIWVMPSTWWQKSTTDVMVEKMIDLMQLHQTFTWWAARDAISGSVGPFLKKRMTERQCYRHVDDDIREDKDLERRAQSIRSRMAMGMVRFPLHAPWWGEAEKELLAFPNGKHDDFVAALAMLGTGLDKMLKADGGKPKDIPNQGTYAWHTYGQQPKDEVKGWA